jgi:hypothetical protein
MTDVRGDMSLALDERLRRNIRLRSVIRLEWLIQYEFTTVPEALFSLRTCSRSVTPTIGQKFSRIAAVTFLTLDP